MLELVCFSFVDDDDVITTGEDVETRGEDIIERTQQTLDIKNGGLHASGGALSVKKCKWRLIDWERTEFSWRMRSRDDMPGSLYLHRYEENDKVAIERQEPTEARECLGVFLSSCGSWEAQKEVLKEKMNTFGEKLRMGNFSKEEAHTAGKAMAWKKWNIFIQWRDYRRNNGTKS